MKVGNYPVNQQNMNNQNTTAGVTDSIQVGNTKTNTGLPQTLATLTQGDIFEATVTRDASGKLTIHLGNGESVFARLDGTVNLLENTATFFEVKSNQEGQLALRAVSQEPGANPTLLRALSQANVAIDKVNLSLVQEMMKQQLPIDAKSLSAMVRVAYANKEVEPSTLVQLTKLGLPVTSDNIEQYQQYSSGKGNVVETLNHIMDRLPNALSDAEASGLDGKAIFSNLQDIFGGNANALQGTITHNMTADGFEQNSQMQAEGASDINAGEAGSHVGVIEMTDVLEDGVDKTQLSKESVIPSQLPQGEADSLETVTRQISGNTGGTAETGNSQMRGPENILEQVGKMQEEGEFSPKEIFSRLADIIQKTNMTGAEYAKLFQGKEFKNLLRDIMQQEWLLLPEQVKGEGKISEVYEKMQMQLKRLEDLMHQLGQDNHAVAQDAKNVRANVQFMNDLNQFFNYVQIPLKMANQNAKGDLYVYTDKRALKQGKEEVTAHLHLELEHLGTTDVFVRLKEKKLSTNFIMEKEESFDLVMKNIDRLTEHLQKKGYSVTTKVEMKSEETKAPEFMQEILNKELPSVAIQRYSLDVCV